MSYSGIDADSILRFFSSSKCGKGKKFNETLCKKGFSSFAFEEKVEKEENLFRGIIYWDRLSLDGKRTSEKLKSRITLSTPDGEPFQVCICRSVP